MDPLEYQEQVKNNILKNLQTVIDPETGVDVVAMRLIEDLTVDANGKASYIFRPSSPICPLAVTLALDIMKAISLADGVKSQAISVKDYIQAEQLTEILQQQLDDEQ